MNRFEAIGIGVLTELSDNGNSTIKVFRTPDRLRLDTPMFELTVHKDQLGALDNINVLYAMTQVLARESLGLVELEREIVASN